MKTTQAQFYEYEIKGSMFLAMGEFDRELTDVIMHLMDTQTDELPVKEDLLKIQKR